MEINCPPAGKNVLVSGQGSGSGGAGTICVRGTLTDQDARGEGLPMTVRVCVVAGWVTPPPPDPNSPPPGWVDTTPAGQDWCAVGVGVPDSSPTGVQCTAITWYRVGGTSWSEPAAVYFYAGGPDPVDCCGASGGVVSSASAAAFQSWPPPPPPLPPNLNDGAG